MKLPVVLLCLFLIGNVLRADDAPQYPGVKGTDEEITQRLTGTWTCKRMGFQGTMVYRADGVCTTDLIPVDFFVKVVADPYYFSGTWEIKDGILWSTVLKSNSKAIAVGTRYRDELQLLTDDTFVTKNEKGMVTTFKRLKAKG